jgi:hypothetical protein
MYLVTINSAQLQNYTRGGSAQGFIGIKLIKKKKRGGVLWEWEARLEKKMSVFT